ncbi:MAG: DNA/RNA non-specific endonuclease, partial [Prevotella sp.]|nr:DNA/RNA non-specific endonuclease [Prevotella sp.]
LIVPKYFFMAILCKNKQGYKAIGFWVEHLNEDRSNDNLIDYVVSIDELERLTGIDFFCNLPDDEEEQAERIVYPNTWGFR